MSKKSNSASYQSKRRKDRDMKRLIAAVIAALIAVVLTVGEFSGGDMPSWSAMFSASNTEEDGGSTSLIGDAHVEVHAIDVGQGDCTLIRCGEQNILIDAGDNGRGEDVLSYLSDIGVERLDMVIATHPHADHIGGLDEVISEMDVGGIIMPLIPDSQVPTGVTYSDFLDAIADKKLKAKKAEAGDVYEFDGVEMTILSPEKGETFGDLNDYSVAVVFRYLDFSFFTAGDITTKVEKNLLDRIEPFTVDLYKASHHGGAASNYGSFVRMLSPKYAYVQSGRDNSYGHPHEEVVDLFDKLKIKMCRNDTDGTIVYRTDGDEMEYEKKGA
ncbi:MAG: MBL fold metallo-hydrolase [Oscillospiraceae bacterium]|nr:MBL fold metallo-hydrolase [Oscillospiraceae bacterium]